MIHKTIRECPSRTVNYLCEEMSRKTLQTWNWGKGRGRGGSSVLSDGKSWETIPWSESAGVGMVSYALETFIIYLWPDTGGKMGQGWREGREGSGSLGDVKRF